VLGLCLAISPGAFADEETDADDTTLLDAVTKGTFTLNLRYRYEEVDQDGFDNKGKASTLRTMAGYRTGTWNGLEVYLEFEDIRNLGLSNEHNNGGAGDLGNGATDYPVIADPALTEINQAYLGWKPIDGLPFRFGLQEIIIDNHRFVGNVLWRQNHQTFEAARGDFTGVENLKISYSYIGRQHTVTGASLPMSTSHLGVSYDIGEIGTVKGYWMLLDYDHEMHLFKNTSTFGAFFDGSAKLSDTLELGYRLEYAKQTDSNNPDANIDADYLFADLGLTVSKVRFGIGYEVLGGSPQDGQFNTPLATLHKFNGWADKFLTTPILGLQDLFISINAKLGRFTLTGVYHDFSSDSGGFDWGTEFDAAVVYTAPWKQKFSIKYADYDAKDHATDTRKLWIWTSWGF
jgi:hypothetical protein